MVYIAQLLKKCKEDVSNKKLMRDNESTILIFMIILATIILSVDYALILKFVDIIKKL